MYSTDVKFKKLKIIFLKTFFYFKFLLELKSYCSSRIYLYLLFYKAYRTWLLFSFFSSQNHRKFICSLFFRPSFHFSTISPRFKVLLLSYVLENISICRKTYFLFMSVRPLQIFRVGFSLDTRFYLFSSQTLFKTIKNKRKRLMNSLESFVFNLTE